MDPAIWLCVAFIKEVFDTLLYFLGYASGPRAEVGVGSRHFSRILHNLYFYNQRKLADLTCYRMAQHRGNLPAYFVMSVQP